MSQSRVAGRYAKALLDLAIEQNQLDAVFNDISSLDNALEASSELEALLNNPVIPQDKKKSIFSALFQDKMNEVSFGFLNLILGKRRENDLQAIVDSFVELYNNEKGITEVTLTTAIPLTAETEQKIIQKIQSTSSLDQIHLTKKVDPAIIGGYIVEFNNRILDNSIQTNLNSIKRRYSAN